MLIWYNLCQISVELNNLLMVVEMNKKLIRFHSLQTAVTFLFFEAILKGKVLKLGELYLRLTVLSKM